MICVHFIYYYVCFYAGGLPPMVKREKESDVWRFFKSAVDLLKGKWPIGTCRLEKNSKNTWTEDSDDAQCAEKIGTGKKAVSTTTMKRHLQSKKHGMLLLPCLSVVGRTLCKPAATEGNTERVFSREKLIHSACRNQLGPDISTLGWLIMHPFAGAQVHFPIFQNST